MIGVDIEQYDSSLPDKYLRGLLQDKSDLDAPDAFKSYLAIVPSAPVAFDAFARLVSFIFQSIEAIPTLYGLNIFSKASLIDLKNSRLQYDNGIRILYYIGPYFKYLFGLEICILFLLIIGKGASRFSTSLLPVDTLEHPVCIQNRKEFFISYICWQYTTISLRLC